MKKRKLTPAILFCLICAIGLSAVVGSFVLSNADMWSRFFWFNTGEYEQFWYADTGMDFLHSIEYMKGNNPYQQWGTIYPPLANLFFKVLFHTVPDVEKQYWKDDFMSSIWLRRSDNDLRVWMPTLLLYVLFFILVSLMTHMIIADYYKKRNHVVLAFSTMFSYGYIFAVERGNIILLSMATALFFMLYKDSPRAWVRELALLSLAVSANLKLYPAVYGVMLLYNKRWKEAIRAIIYGVLLFVLPCLIFNNGLGNIRCFIDNVKHFSGTLELKNLGTSFDKILYSFCEMGKRWLGIPIPSDFFLGPVLTINRIVLPVCLACGLFMPKQWQKCLCCTLGIILFSNQGIYGTVFLTLPAVMFFKEEKRFTRDNIAPFIGFVLGIACLPVFNKPGSNFSRTSFRLQMGLLVLLVYVIVSVVRLLVSRRKEKALTAS